MTFAAIAADVSRAVRRLISSRVKSIENLLNVNNHPIACGGLGCTWPDGTTQSRTESFPKKGMAGNYLLAGGANGHDWPIGASADLPRTQMVHRRWPIRTGFGGTGSCRHPLEVDQQHPGPSGAVCFPRPFGE